MPLEYHRDILHIFGTLKNAYIRLDLMKAGMSYGMFRLALIGEPTTPARANVVVAAWERYLQKHPGTALESTEPKPRKKQSVRRVPKLDKYIRDVNKNKLFRFREDEREEGKSDTDV